MKMEIVANDTLLTGALEDLELPGRVDDHQFSSVLRSGMICRGNSKLQRLAIFAMKKDISKIRNVMAQAAGKR